MEAKEKAQELVNKFREAIYKGQIFTDDFNPIRERNHIERAKSVAIICVNEILDTCPQKENEIFGVSKGIKYWQSVKAEIEKL